MIDHEYTCARDATRNSSIYSQCLIPNERMEDCKFHGWSGEKRWQPFGRPFSLFQDVIASPAGNATGLPRLSVLGSEARGVETMPGFSARSMRLCSSRSRLPSQLAACVTPRMDLAGISSVHERTILYGGRAKVQGRSILRIFLKLMDKEGPTGSRRLNIGYIARDSIRC